MKQDKKSFTLIELLVVIAIISILAGMLLPALSSTKNTAMTATCYSNQKQIALAQQNYSSDWFYVRYVSGQQNSRWDKMFVSLGLLPGDSNVTICPALAPNALGNGPYGVYNEQGTATYYQLSKAKKPSLTGALCCAVSKSSKAGNGVLDPTRDTGEYYGRPATLHNRQKMVVFAFLDGHTETRSEQNMREIRSPNDSTNKYKFYYSPLTKSYLPTAAQ